MVDEPAPRRLLPRLLLTVAAAATGGGGAYAAGLPPLDVALWAVLAPLAAHAALELVPRAHRSVVLATHPTPVVVVPEHSVAHAGSPDPAVQAREAVVARARALLLEARQRGDGMDVMLALAEALHEANLDLARATISAGGIVPQALRDELALRARVQPGEQRQPGEQPTTP